MNTHDTIDNLESRFGNDGGDTIHDPHFAEVAKRIAAIDRPSASYMGMPTLLDVPARDIDWNAPDFGDLQVALLGVPLDLAVTNRGGARFGPRALRATERIGPYNHVLDCVPAEQLRVADIGDVPFRSRFSLAKSHEDILATYAAIRKAGVIPVSVGGDHSMTGSILKALASDGPLALVHIDAHCDTEGPMEGEPLHHGGPFRQATLAGAIDPAHVIQIGIRGAAEFVWEFSYASGMTVIHAEEVDAMGIDAVLAKARAIVGDMPVYMSLDIDGIDPAFAPGTGTPEVGGLTPREVQRLLRGLEGIDIVGGDVVEVAPAYDATHNTAHVGAQMLFEILSLVCVRLAGRIGG